MELTSPTWRYIIPSNVHFPPSFLSSQHYYTCTKEILFGLGQMYASGGEFTQNIDAYGGEGTAEFVAKAICIYCKA